MHALFAAVVQLNVAEHGDTQCKFPIETNGSYVCRYTQVADKLSSGLLTNLSWLGKPKLRPRPAGKRRPETEARDPSAFCFDSGRTIRSVDRTRFW
jgi:hypothetical protein